MSRAARTFSESGIYHVMFRGLNKQAIFLENSDYKKILEIMADLKETMKFEIYAYCLMTNHVHMVIKEKETRDISDIMRRLIGKYAQWFNFKYERSGTLMENRYKSRVVDRDEYFVHLVRYVHQNPVQAGLTENAGDYAWSSYADYLSDTPRLTNTEFLFEILPKKDFVKFHNEIEKRDFDFKDGAKPTDGEMKVMLEQLGVADPEKLMYLPPIEFERIVSKLRERFSDRHIVRVTNVPRYRLLSMNERR